ncbi:MAG: hypothetical protein JST90_16825 [Bacteroidetes bacterium]|nr:hypothetical protein [Bacteroidota bacterium]
MKKEKAELTLQRLKQEGKLETPSNLEFEWIVAPINPKIRNQYVRVLPDNTFRYDESIIDDDTSFAVYGLNGLHNTPMGTLNNWNPSFETTI